MAEAGTRQLDGADELLDGVILTEDDLLQIGFEMLQARLLVDGDRARRNLGHAGDDLLDLVLADDLWSGGLQASVRRAEARRSTQHPSPRTCLVQHVDRLVRQMSIVQVLR